MDNEREYSTNIPVYMQLCKMRFFQSVPAVAALLERVNTASLFHSFNQLLVKGRLISKNPLISKSLITLTIAVFLLRFFWAEHLYTASRRLLGLCTATSLRATLDHFEGQTCSLLTCLFNRKSQIFLTVLYLQFGRHKAQKKVRRKDPYPS